MPKYYMTQTTISHTIQRALSAYVEHAIKRLRALYHEWRTRRDIKRAFCHLTGHELRDIGLTRGDIDAACTDSYQRSASSALKTAAQERGGRLRINE